MYMNFLCTYSQQLYKPALRGLSAIAELLVLSCLKNILVDMHQFATGFNQQCGVKFLSSV